MVGGGKDAAAAADDDEAEQVGGFKIMTLETLALRKERPAGAVEASAAPAETPAEYDPVEVDGKRLVQITRPATGDEVAVFDLANNLHTLDTICQALLGGGLIAFAMTVGLYAAL